MTTEKSQPSPPPPNVAVIIPHLERIGDTAACCASLAGQTAPPAAILVVDNGSRSHTPGDLAAACPAATIVSLEHNLGFAGGVNAGLRRALVLPGTDFFLILNNDTLCPTDLLARLTATARGDGRIGLVACPLVETRNGRRTSVPPGKNLATPCRIPLPAPAGRIPDYLSGACLLIRRAVLDEIGLFDEDFFFFFEDADFSLRARNHHWRLAVDDQTEVIHTGSATIGALNLRQARYYRSGHIRLLRKTTRHPLPRALPPFLFRLLTDALRGRSEAVRGNLDGWRDGWRGAAARCPTSPSDK